jgi:hypothetical protein
MYRSRVLGWRPAWMRNESAPACRHEKFQRRNLIGLWTQFQEMSRNYLTPDNHKSKAYYLHIGRQLTGNANSLKET